MKKATQPALTKEQESPVEGRKRPTLTKEQKAEVKSWMEDAGYTRAEAIAIVLAGVLCL